MHLRAKLEVSASRRLRCAFVPPPPDRNSRVFPPRRPNPPPRGPRRGWVPAGRLRGPTPASRRWGPPPRAGTRGTRAPGLRGRSPRSSRRRMIEGGVAVDAPDSYDECRRALRNVRSSFGGANARRNGQRQLAAAPLSARGPAGTPAGQPHSPRAPSARLGIAADSLRLASVAILVALGWPTHASRHLDE